VNVIEGGKGIFSYFHKAPLFQTIFNIILVIWIFSIPLKNSIYQISTVLLILLFLFHITFYKQTKKFLETIQRNNQLIILFLLLLTTMFLSSLFGVSDINGILQVFKYFYRYIFILIILFYFYEQRFFSIKFILTLIFFTLFTNALNGLYQYLFGLDFIVHKAPDHKTLLTGAVYHHNPFGLLMALGAIFSLVLFFDTKKYLQIKYEKTLFLISSLLFLFTLFHSQSRSAWVMFGLFSLGFLILYIRKNGIDKKLLFTIGILILSVVIIFLSDDNLQHRLALLFQGNSAGRTTQIWPSTLEKVKESPFWGYGVNTYKILFEGTKAGHHAGVHNLTLEFLLYTGIIGFFIFIYLLIVTLKQSLKVRKYIYFILLLAYIILLQFDGSLMNSKVHLNIFILLLFFIYAPKSQKKVKNHV